VVSVDPVVSSSSPHEAATSDATASTDMKIRPLRPYLVRFT
jgi:hypothetical protein